MKAGILATPLRYCDISHFYTYTPLDLGTYVGILPGTTNNCMHTSYII